MGSQISRFLSQHCHLLATWPWAIYLTSLSGLNYAVRDNFLLSFSRRCNRKSIELENHGLLVSTPGSLNLFILSLSFLIYEKKGIKSSNLLSLFHILGYKKYSSSHSILHLCGKMNFLNVPHFSLVQVLLQG